MFLHIVIVIFCLVFSGESTDIAAVYRHGIIIVKEADRITPKLPLETKPLEVPLSHVFAYPTALAYEPFASKFFLSDINDVNTEIFSISLKTNPATVEPLVSKEISSEVNIIVYNPLNHQLLWTDSKNHGIYFVDVSSSEHSLPSKLFTDRHIHTPRGIALDYCDGILYWTERNEESSIQMADLEKKSVQSLKKSDGNTFYQAIDYDPIHHQLIWAETDGDDASSASCRIMIKTLETGAESLLHSSDNCYPFSLTSDQDHIYWSDWNKKGIMRISRKHPQDSLVKLVNTPSVESEEDGTHISAFGIVNIQRNFSRRESCLAMSHHHPSQSGKALSSESSMEAEPTTQSSTFLNERVVYSKIKDSGDVSFPDVQSAASSITCGSIQHRLKIVIIVLSCVSLFFVSTTLLLLLRNVFSRQKFIEGIKGLFVVLPAAATTVQPQMKKPKSHRTFRASSKVLDGPLCPREADDGVKIEIEDCCQMTLCDTPCYTTVKKEGKGYKKKTPNRAADKESLLTDEET